MKGIEVLNNESIPQTGAVVVPARLNAAEQAALERALGGRPTTTFALSDIENGQATTIRQTVESGGFAIFRPGSVHAWPGTLCDLARADMEAILSLGLPVLPVAVDRPGETPLSIENRSALPAATLAFGRPLIGRDLNVPKLLESLFAAGEEAFSRRPLFRTHLAYALLRGLKAHGNGVIVDGSDESRMTYGEVLAAALALSRRLKEETAKPRVAIVLPPGRAGFIANLAVLFAGKIPVNLNYTAGKEAVESAIRQSEVDRFLTVDLVVRKMQTFPWPPTKQLLLVERIMPALKSKAILWGILSKVLPAPALASVLGIPKRGGDTEAALLFTSGSSGEPKGVALTHRNLLANVTQFASRLCLRQEDRILGSLPLFHSFGCTVTLWYPAIEGFGLVTYPSPFDPPKLATLIEKFRVSLLISTPTFLRGYLRKVKREQLASLRLVVTGAEKLPSNVAQAFKEAFGQDVLEGYGLTETSPVTNVGLPPLPDPGDGTPVLPSHRPGSVGQLMPGLAIRITDPTNNEPLPLNQSGMIWFKGSNIFPGYLKQPRKTEEVLQNGWFRTGDIGRVDEDGFLYIEGRLTRFSKIGGEMVPHETVEDHIVRALGLDGDSERKIAVVGVPDADKGEALVLLSTVASEAIKQEVIQLRYALLDRGVPPLWIPKKLLRVAEIPVLASGKLDLVKCADLALRAQ